MTYTPPTHGIKSISWTPQSNVGTNIGTFAFGRNTYDWLGQQRVAEVTLCNMAPRQAKDWQAFFLKLNGAAGNFYLNDVQCSSQVDGDWTGTPVVASGNTPFAQSIILSGASASAEYCVNGDIFSVDDRIYTALDTINHPGGNITIPIWPRLHGTVPATSTSVELNGSTRGVFALKEIPSWAWNIGAYQEELTFTAYEEIVI